ncbi:MAG: nucleotidyltransferase domain-containing protein [Candidatus Woesearchaeota archaeon]
MARTLKIKEPKEKTESYRRVLSYFFAFPEHPISLNVLSENICVSKSAVKAAVNQLVKLGFLQKEVVGNAWRIIADPKHSLMITEKIPYNLRLVYNSGIIAEIYSKVPGARAIVLFGSYRWGTDNEKSDLDIAVEILGPKEMKIESLRNIDKFGFRKDVAVNLHIFSRSKIDLNLFSNIANGILLDGFLEAHP